MNTGSATMEVCFMFPLPYDGAIDQLTLLVDGKEYEAKLLSKEEARRRYEEIVRKNRDPALLEWVGTGMFQTSVFPVPPGAKRTVTLRYSQLLPQELRPHRFHLPAEHGQVHVRAAREAHDPPGDRKRHADQERLLAHARRRRSSGPTASTPSSSTKRRRSCPAKTSACSSTAAKDQSARASSATGRRPTRTVTSCCSPARRSKRPTTSPSPKTVVFVVDRSGSMSGEKIEQAKGAVKFVLNNLREGDMFNIVAYDSEVETFRPELQKFNDETRAAALGFVEGLYAGGSTNIDGALKRALGMLDDSSRPTYVLFLTDGLPTAGETNEAAIVKHSEEANHVRARMFAFGVGYDVNSRLLDKLARDNFGQSEYVRPNEDIEASVSALYRKIGAPVMTDVAVTVDVEGAAADGARPSTASIRKARSTCSPAIRSCSSAAITTAARPR